MPVPEWRWASSEAEAVEAAAELAGSMVLKADVADVVRQPDVGAVSLDLSTEDAVRRSYRTMAERLGDRLRGVLVQPMAAPDVEVLAAVVQEPVFGPLVIFALGGVATPTSWPTVPPGSCPSPTPARRCRVAAGIPRETGRGCRGLEQA